VPAARCLDLGLANRVVPAERLLETAQAWAADLARRPTLALALSKQALHGGLTASLQETISLEARLQARCIESEDHREGVAAFLQKRRPDFKGR
jgi:2-(1,2-epoxy-1,2-dihydrophenyl)acetyl-CoA isomerase